MPKPILKHIAIKLNLLHPQGSGQKLPERFLKWLISYGRFIVVAVEVVVIGAFLMRFSLDAKLDELKKKINDDVPIVILQSTDEALIKQTQQRLSIFSKEFDQSSAWTDILKELTGKMPAKVVFGSLNLQKDPANPLIKFRLNAKTAINSEMGQYLNTLKKNPFFKDITLVNVNYDQNQFLFVISGSTIK